MRALANSAVAGCENVQQAGRFGQQVAGDIYDALIFLGGEIAAVISGGDGIRVDSRH